jgi:hypothetical protein
VNSLIRRRVTAGGQQRVAAHDDPQRLQQPGWLGVFEQEPAGAGPQRGEDVFVEAEVGEDHDAHAFQPRVRGDLPGGLEAVQHRHLNVHQRDVRAVLGGQPHRLQPVGGLGGHLDVVFGVQQRADAAADQRLVISQQHPDHDGARAGSSARTRKPPASRGPARSRPPSAVTRSRMPMRPSPGPAGRGRVYGGLPSRQHQWHGNERYVPARGGSIQMSTSKTIATVRSCLAVFMPA